MSGPSESEPFAAYLGLRLTSLGEVGLTIRPDLVNSVGKLLGPVGFALVDYAMGDVAWHGLEPGRTAVTINIAINYLGSAADGDVVCTARLDRRGRRVVATSAEVRHADGRLMIMAVGTFAVTGGGPAPAPR
jgi:acyl-CoA thioesterase